MHCCNISTKTNTGFGKRTKCSNLFLFGVELEALVQGAAVLLDVLLLQTPHALGVLHHLLVDVTEQAGTDDKLSKNTPAALKTEEGSLTSL